MSITARQNFRMGGGEFILPDFIHALDSDFSNNDPQSAFKFNPLALASEYFRKASSLAVESFSISLRPVIHEEPWPQKLKFPKASKLISHPLNGAKSLPPRRM